MTCDRKIIFAVYKGDELLALGNKEECCEILGCKASTLEMEASPAYRRRRKTENSRRVIRWREDGEI
jgi:hypothetical protein